MGGRDADSGFQFDLGGALARLSGDETDQPDRGAPAGPTAVAPPPAPASSPAAPAGPSAPSAPLPSRPQPMSPAEPPPGASPASSSAPVASPTPRPAEEQPLPSRSQQQMPPAEQPLPSRSQPGRVTETLPWRVEQPPVVEPPAHRVEPEPPAATTTAPTTTPTTTPTNTVSATTTDAEPTQYPRRVPGTHFDPHAGAAAAPTPTTHAPATPAAPEPSSAAPDPQPAARTMQRQSVFDDIGSPGGSGSPALPAGSAPSLPEANPAAPPPIAEPVSAAPSTPEITALRSAQIRQSKQQRQGKLFGRSLLAFVLIGGLLGGALVFGRSLLFPTAWDAQLTPIVNEIQDTRGVEFVEVTAYEQLPAAEFGARLSAATFGPDWPNRVPEWRALGLATGDVSVASVAPALAVSLTAFYDPGTNTIYQVEGIDPAASTVELRIALEQVLERQVGATDPSAAAQAAPATVAGPDVTTPDDGAAIAESDPAAPTGWTGVSSLDSIADRAVDELLANGGAAQSRQPANEQLPVPLAYEVAAIDSLGEAVLAAAGVDASTLTPGGDHPDAIGQVLDDGAVATTSGLLRPGEVSLADPVALGPDDWSLAWGTRLPESTVALLVDQVVADSYRPVDRSGVVCFIAVFETASPDSGNSVLASMQSWAANAPAASQAAASQLGPTRIQLEACDPGVGGGVEPRAGVVDALIDRQQRRLTN